MRTGKICYKTHLIIQSSKIIIIYREGRILRILLSRMEVKMGKTGWRNGKLIAKSVEIQDDLIYKGTVAAGEAIKIGTADACIITKNGAPTSGTSGTGAGTCGKGSLCLDTSNGRLYLNAGTKASPDWKYTAFST